MYLSSLIDSGKSDSVVSSAYYGIKWYHNISDSRDPTDSLLVKAMLECAKRLNSKPIVKKDVVTSEQLVTLCDMFVGSTDVITLRDVSIILLSYAGLLRFDEVSSLRCNDVTIHDDHIRLFIKKSKTDIYRKGNEVLISQGETSACPLRMLQRCISSAHLQLGGDIFLFRPACRSGEKCFFYKRTKSLVIHVLGNV